MSPTNSPKTEAAKAPDSSTGVDELVDKTKMLTLEELKDGTSISVYPSGESPNASQTSTTEGTPMEQSPADAKEEPGEMSRDESETTRTTPEKPAMKLPITSQQISQKPRFVISDENKIVEILEVGPNDLFRVGDYMEVVFTQDEYFVARHLDKDTEHVFPAMQCDVVMELPFPTKEYSAKKAAQFDKTPSEYRAKVTEVKGRRSALAPEEIVKMYKKVKADAKEKAGERAERQSSKRQVYKEPSSSQYGFWPDTDMGMNAAISMMHESQYSQLQDSHTPSLYDTNSSEIAHNLYGTAPAILGKYHAFNMTNTGMSELHAAAHQIAASAAANPGAVSPEHTDQNLPGFRSPIHAASAEKNHEGSSSNPTTSSFVKTGSTASGGGVSPYASFNPPSYAGSGAAMGAAAAMNAAGSLSAAAKSQQQGLYWADQIQRFCAAYRFWETQMGAPQTQLSDFGVPYPIGEVNRGSKYLATFIVGVDDTEEFRVSKKIIGLYGKHMKNISTIIPMAKVRLRGRGSGFAERATGVEADEELQVNISVPTWEGYTVCKHIVGSLLEKVYAEYRAQTGYKVQLRLMEHPKNPRGTVPPQKCELFLQNPVFKFANAHEYNSVLEMSREGKLRAQHLHQ